MDLLLKTLGSGGEAPPGRPKSEDLPLKTLGSGGEAPPSRPKSEDLPLKTLGSGEPDRCRIGSRLGVCILPGRPYVKTKSFDKNDKIEAVSSCCRTGGSAAAA